MAPPGAQLGTARRPRAEPNSRSSRLWVSMATKTARREVEDQVPERPERILGVLVPKIAQEQHVARMWSSRT